MPKESKAKQNSEKALSVDNLRWAEYYDMQDTFDGLYAKSKEGETFEDLMGTILSRENILLAYRSIKGNGGSVTPGTDKTTIKDLGTLTPDELVKQVRFIVSGSVHGYRPKPVRRKDIPKPNGSTRPLGIPCMWDRLIQQCIKQVLEPICEAKFSDNSYGFRPQRSVENAIKATYNRLQLSNLHYVIEFDIKGFFDNVNHSKLIKQIWAMGIHDKHLIYVTKQILKAPVKMPDGHIEYPSKGTPQGGIISPLLANIVLNELDQWVGSQWENHPVTRRYAIPINNNGSERKTNGYRAMRKTKLKEMYIIRYADDFRIFCKTKTDAEKVKIAVTQWLEKRLRLEVSQEKTKIVNVKRNYSEFLGFKIKVHKKSDKYVVKSHISDKKAKQIRDKLAQQAKNVTNPRAGKKERDEVMLYNAMVMGEQNYYQIATEISIDLKPIQRNVMTILKNRLGTEKGNRLAKEYTKVKKKGKPATSKRSGRELTKIERIRYGKSKQLRWIKGSGEPIYPIGYVQHKNPMPKKRSVCPYTPEGRIGMHDNRRVNTKPLLELMRQPLYNGSAEYADNRLSLFSAQWGRCAVTGAEFTATSDIHCHHKKLKSNGGSDKYENLVLVLEPVHKLIHAQKPETIAHYLEVLNLNPAQLEKVNGLRKQAGILEIKSEPCKGTQNEIYNTYSLRQKG